VRMTVRTRYPRVRTRYPGVRMTVRTTYPCVRMAVRTRYPCVRASYPRIRMTVRTRYPCVRMAVRTNYSRVHGDTWIPRTYSHMYTGITCTYGRTYEVSMCTYGDVGAIEIFDILICFSYFVVYHVNCVFVLQTLLLYDRPEDLYQGVGLIYSLFHADINNLTLCLLNTTLPRLLLLQSGTTVSSMSTSTSSLKLLTDPRGSALAKLCIMCINLAYTARHLSGSSAGASGQIWYW